MHIDDIIESFKRIEGTLSESTCNIRKTGAMLVLPDGREYLATNGSKEDPCTDGPGTCECRNSLPVLDYATCRSFCAEGYAMKKASNDTEKENDKDISGSIMLSTSLPCVRCTDLIIDKGISEVYFKGFRNGIMRNKDAIYIAKMNASGINVYDVESGEIQRRESPEEFQREVMALYPPMPGLWMRLEDDKRFRESQKNFLLWLKQNFAYSSAPERRMRI